MLLAAADVAAAVTGPRRMGVIYGSGRMRSARPFFGWGIRRAGFLASPHSNTGKNALSVARRTIP